MVQFFTDVYFSSKRKCGLFRKGTQILHVTRAAQGLWTSPSCIRIRPKWTKGRSFLDWGLWFCYTLVGRHTLFVRLLCKEEQQQRGWDSSPHGDRLQVAALTLARKTALIFIWNKIIALCLPDYTAASKGHTGDLANGDNSNNRGYILGCIVVNTIHPLFFPCVFSFFFWLTKIYI